MPTLPIPTASQLHRMTPSQLAAFAEERQRAKTLERNAREFLRGLAVELEPLRFLME